MADQSLIQGAYGAAQSKFTGKLAGSQTAQGITKGLGDIATGYLQEKALQQKQYDVMAQAVIDQAGELSPQVKSELFDELQDGRNDFVWGDKKGKMLSMDNLNTKAKGYAKFMEARLNLAELTEDSSKNPDAEGTLSNYFANSGEYDDYLKMLESDAKPIFKDGVPGFTIGGEWKSVDSINSVVEKDGLRDDGFQTNLDNVLDSYMEMSSKVMPGQEMAFPEASAKNMVRNKLINKATNLKSVAYDNMFGDTSFYDDAIDGFQQGTYSDLGIQDPTGGTVTREDAEIMARTLINDSKYEGTLKNELTTYYTKFLKQNWREGKEFRPEAQEGFRFTGGPYVENDVLNDEEELSGNQTDEQDQIINPYESMNIDLVKSVQAGDNNTPVVKSETVAGGKGSITDRMNNMLGSYGFTIEKGGANEILINHISGEKGSFKVGGKVLGIGMASKKQNQADDINEFINRVSQMQINWDEYNKTYGLETQE